METIVTYPIPFSYTYGRPAFYTVAAYQSRLLVYPNRVVLAIAKLGTITMDNFISMYPDHEVTSYAKELCPHLFI